MSDANVLDARYYVEVEWYCKTMGFKTMPASLEAKERADKRAELEKTRQGKSGKITDTSAADDHKSFPFFKLPAEVRNRVYKYLVTAHPSPPRLFIPRYADANKHMRAELLPVFIAGLNWRIYIGVPCGWVRAMIWFRVLGDNARFLSHFKIISSFRGCCGTVKIDLEAPAERDVNPHFITEKETGGAEIMRAFTRMLFDDLNSLRKRGVMNGELFVMSFVTFCDEYSHVTWEDVEPGRLANAHG